MNLVPGSTERAQQSLLHSRHVVVGASILLLLLLAVALLIVYEDAGIVREQINEDYNRQQLVLAKRAAADISGDLSDLIQEVDETAWIIGQTTAGREIDSAIARALLRYEARGLQSLRLISPDSASCVLESPGDQRLGSLNLNRKGSAGFTYTSTLCRPVIRNGQITGMLEAIVNVSSLLESVMIDVRPGKSGYGWVIDRDGRFLYHPDEGLIGQGAFASLTANGSDEASNGVDRVTLTEMTTGREGTGSYISGWHGSDQTEAPKLVAFAPVDAHELPTDQVWPVAVSTPVPEVAASVHNVEVRHIIAEVAIVGGIFLFGILVMIYQMRLSRTLEEEVTEKEKFLGSILGSSVDAIVFIDNDNRVQVWNRGAEFVFGYTADEMIGQTFHRLIPPEMNADQELNNIAQEVSRKSYIRNYRAQRMTKSGKRITIDLSRTMVFSEDNKPLGSTAIIKDITEKEELDKLIYNTEKLASIGTLAAGVAHEINNPLTVILGFTDLLREKFPQDSSESKDLMMIEENANTAKRIVEDMLGFARITEGLEDKVEVKHAIERVISIVEVTLKQENITVRNNVPDGLPTVRGDSREFQQVIFNLINNAMAAMADTGGLLTIEAHVTDSRISISVSDTGIGIPEKVRGQIFDPFFTTKKVGEGTGLGLSLCYGIVRKYGGSIEFTSTARVDHPDRPSGTTFTVSMPVYEPDDSH